MKAIIVREFGEAEVMKLEEISDLVPNEKQILVKIKAVGVNPVDTYIRSGNYAQKPSLPFTPGKDGAGIIEKIGENVTKFEVGDRVFVTNASSGTYAEFAVCEESQVHHLPENVSFEQGAGVYVPYATAFRGLLQKAKAKASETVLIHGASGGVGIAAVQVAKNAGLTVIGTASSAEGKKLVKEQGADFVFDHSHENYLEEIKEATAGKGADIILEMLANVNLVKDFEVLTMFGRIVIIGNRGSLDFNPRLTMGKDATIYGLSLFNASVEDIEEINSKLFQGLKEGWLNPIVGKVFPLAEAAQAHREIIADKAFGKMLLIP